MNTDTKNLTQRRKDAEKGKKRLAVLTRPLEGRFTKWKAGEYVYAKHVRGSQYGIEKLKRKPAGILREGLPLINELAGVPRSALKFVELDNFPVRKRRS